MTRQERVLHNRINGLERHAWRLEDEARETARRSQELKQEAARLRATLPAEKDKPHD